MVDPWHFLGSTILQRLGKLTLREDAWRLPTGILRRYPVLHVGTTVGVVPFVDPGRVVPFREAVAMALDDRITESVSKVALLAAALTLGHRP